MILGLDDFVIIFALLTPVYKLAWNNSELAKAIDTRLQIIERSHNRLHKGE